MSKGDQEWQSGMVTSWGCALTQFPGQGQPV